MSTRPVADDPHEFHRRRAETEMEMALHAKKPSIAMLHLELAKRHREKRNELVRENRNGLRLTPMRVFNGTDKES